MLTISDDPLSWIVMSRIIFERFGVRQIWNKTNVDKKPTEMAEPGPGTPLDRFSVSNYIDVVEYKFLRTPNSKVGKLTTGLMSPGYPRDISPGYPRDIPGYLGISLPPERAALDSLKHCLGSTRRHHCDFLVKMNFQQTCAFAAGGLTSPLGFQLLLQRGG